MLLGGGHHRLVNGSPQVCDRSVLADQIVEVEQGPLVPQRSVVSFRIELLDVGTLVRHQPGSVGRLLRVAVLVVLSAVSLRLLISALARTPGVSLACDLDLGAQRFSLRLSPLELRRQVAEDGGKGRRRLFLRSLVDGVVVEERLDLVQLIELGCRAALRRLELRLYLLDGFLPCSGGRVVVTFLGDLIETRREHLRGQRHINVVVVPLDDGRRLAFFHARAADGTFAFVSGPERILDEGLLLLVDFVQIASLFESGHVARHDARLVVFPSLEVEIGFVEVRPGWDHLALLVEELKLRDIVCIAIHIVGPSRDSAYVAGVIAQDVSREIHRLVPIVLGKQERSLIEQLLFRNQILVLY